MRKRLRLPLSDCAGCGAGRGRWSSSAAAGLQSDRETPGLPEVRVDVDIVLGVGGWAGVELGGAVVNNVASGIDSEVGVWCGTLVALDLSCGGCWKEYLSMFDSWIPSTHTCHDTAISHRIYNAAILDVECDGVLSAIGPDLSIW